MPTTPSFDPGRFTMGPWQSCSDPDCGPTGCGLIYGPERHLLGRAFSKADAASFEADPAHFVDADEMQANARVFASGFDMVVALTAAMHALRSYQHGNTATDLAKDVADRCDIALAKATGSLA